MEGGSSTTYSSKEHINDVRINKGTDAPWSTRVKYLQRTTGVI